MKKNRLKKTAPSPGANVRRITDGGFTGNGRLTTDIILQAPELFYFDMQSYVNSINAAKAVDMYNRARLLDMYESALLDLHLSGIIEKRRTGVSRMTVEFVRDGKPDDTVNVELRAPWFRRFVKDVLMTKFWGFSAFQFYRDESGLVDYYRIPYKNFDPIKREILKFEQDSDGISIDAFDGTLCICDDPRSLGMLAELVPMVLYKRGNMSDWAQFCQIFGMPIREYTYDAGDEEARKRLLADARQHGANAVYIHPKESELRLVESGNKSGTVELYERFKDACNTEMSVRVLGNTLTTDAKNTGTQALGTVHKEEEDELKADDCAYVLDVLNYRMADIFAMLGINTDGGEFRYVYNKHLEPSVQVDVISKVRAMGVPVSDDYIYEVTMIDKPDDYDAMKAEIEKRREEERQLALMYAGQTRGQNTDESEIDADNNGTGADNAKNETEPTKKNEPSGAKKKEPIKAKWLSRFFGIAPQ